MCQMLRIAKFLAQECTRMYMTKPKTSKRNLGPIKIARFLWVGMQMVRFHDF